MNKTFYIDDLNKTVNLKFKFDANIIASIKECDFNTRFNKEFNEWIIPINDWSMPKFISLVKVFKFTQVKKKDEKEVVVNYSRSSIDLAYVKGLCDAKGFKYDPRDYQLECLAYSIEHGNVLNGDDVGLGKTFESILYTETTNSFPCIVVTPSSVKYQWRDEWLKITNGKRTVSVIESTETKKRKNDWTADVVIINYDIIGKKQGTGATIRFKELLDIGWKMAIYDEGHFCKNAKSIRSKAALKISKAMSGFTQMLTGTAIQSKPVEIWNLLVIAKMDKLISTDWMSFVRRYCGEYRGNFGLVTDGATNMMELNQKLRDNGYIRREKSEVLKELPDMIEQRYSVPITNKKAIAKAEDDFIQYMLDTKGEEAADNALSAEHLVKLGVMRRLSIEGKMKAIIQWLKDFRESHPNRKLIVFGVHREPLEELAEKFKCMVINGGTSAKKKNELKNEFIDNNDTFLFGNMDAMGTGVDGLQHVSNDMLIIEYPWDTAKLTQVKGRLHRSGQKSAPNINYMFSDETIDVQMWQMLLEKERVVEAVNKGIDVKKSKSGMMAVINKIMKNK